MSIEVKVPQLPESVSDATLLSWHKKPGDSVSRDENLVDLETDKVVLEVPSPANGVLKEIHQEDGATVTSGELLATLEEGDGGGQSAGDEDDAGDDDAERTAADDDGSDDDGSDDNAQRKPRSSADATDDDATDDDATDDDASGDEASRGGAPAGGGRDAHKLSPSVRRLVEKHGLDPADVSGSGRDGRITKADVLAHVGRGDAPASAGGAPAPAGGGGGRNERRVPMTRLRARIAERLVEAQQTAAMLTSFNEVDLGAVMTLRRTYRDSFQEKHGIKLGFMSFFVKAAIEALRRFPAVNASVDGKEIVYHDYFDIGIAVSTERGLVVPVLRDADRMSYADIEAGIGDFAARAREGTISLEDLTGGTFTVTNGGVFGSLMSTPIINPPQSAILGMHKIQERPMVVAGEVVIRPMMYIALTYDHRIIDGREAVLTLVTIKEMLEDPARLLLEV